MSEFVCEPLGKHHDRNAFDCGVQALNEYLRHRASQDMRRRVAAVFVMVPKAEPARIAGFYTLSSATVLLDPLPDDVVKLLPRYPAILIGRLARDASFSGVGQLLLLDALTRCLQHSTAVAAAVVLVDAKDDRARDFYRHYGFVEIDESMDRMFLPMKTIERLLKSPS